MIQKASTVLRKAILYLATKLHRHYRNIAKGHKNKQHGVTNRSLTWVGVLSTAASFMPLCSATIAFPIVSLRTRQHSLTSTATGFSSCNRARISPSCSFRWALICSSFFCLPDKDLMPMDFFLRATAPVVDELLASTFPGTVS